MSIDFGRAAGDYATHRAGFPDRFFDKIMQAGIVRPGGRILDLGTGTGALARGFALRGASVTGLDPSHELMGQARLLDDKAGVAITYIQAKAEATGLPSRAFDLVTAGQCWHWFSRDDAAREAKRLLLPGGTLLIAYLDWLPDPGSVVEATETLILTHNPHWKGAQTFAPYRDYFGDLRRAGLEAIQSFTFDYSISYTHEAWRGRIRASAGIGASLAPTAIAAFDAAHAALLRARFAQDPLDIPHRIFALFGQTPR